MKIKHRRLIAFFVDIMLVCFLTVMMCQVSFANPYLYEYEDALNEYNNVYELVSINVQSDEGIELFLDKLPPSLYKLETKSMYLSIWYLIFYFLYFVVFAYFTEGQTLGKKMMGLKVCKKYGSKVGFLRLTLRALFNGSTLYMGVNITVLLRLIGLAIFKPGTSYFIFYTLSSLLGVVVELGLFITLLINKDNRALNDLICQTKVENI